MNKGLYLMTFLIFIPSVFSQIIISEIMYNPIGSDTNKEWIEIYNSGNSPIDMTGWKFRENNVNHGLNLYQESMTIQPNDFLIISRHGDSFLANYNRYSGNIATSSFSLKNSGEELYILDNNLNEIKFVN
ncbi:lamin tail domain-containing protein, partial [archaeon]|nr:lamin tail domain-containing protein [archaeon]